MAQRGRLSKRNKRRARIAGVRAGARAWRCCGPAPEGVPRRGKGRSRNLEVRQAEWDSDNGYAIGKTDQDMGDCQPKSRKNAPQEIHDSSSRNPLLPDKLCRNQFLAEREKGESRNAEAGDANRDSYNRAAPNRPHEQPSEAEKNPAPEN